MEHWRRRKKKKILEEYFTDKKGDLHIKNSVSLDIISNPYIASDGFTYDIKTTDTLYKSLIPDNVFLSPNTKAPLKVINNSKIDFEKYFVKNSMLNNVFDYIVKKKRRTNKLFGITNW